MMETELSQVGLDGVREGDNPVVRRRGGVHDLTSDVAHLHGVLERSDQEPGQPDVAMRPTTLHVVGRSCAPPR